jgi:hypothetical protein
VYKKGMEVVYRTPELFYPFLAPLLHSFFGKSKVRSKPVLKQIEICLSVCAKVYPSIREELLGIPLDNVDPIILNHVRNLILMFEFLIPVVSCFKFLMLSLFL